MYIFVDVGLVTVSGNFAVLSLSYFYFYVSYGFLSCLIHLLLIVFSHSRDHTWVLVSSF